ncbi:MAG: nuclear transport factor 2 family protein [Rhodospirillaceae bacterium]
MASAEIEALKELYAAINRDDIPGALKFLDPQIERIEPAEFPSAGTYRGLGEVGAHFAQGRGTWAEGACNPEQFIAAGDKIVVFLHVRVRMKNKEDWIEGRFADGFVFRNGKAIEMRTFATRNEALAWAGGDV